MKKFFQVGLLISTMAIIGCGKSDDEEYDYVVETSSYPTYKVASYQIATNPEPKDPWCTDKIEDDVNKLSKLQREYSIDFENFKRDRQSDELALTWVKKVIELADHCTTTGVGNLQNNCTISNAAAQNTYDLNNGLIKYINAEKVRRVCDSANKIANEVRQLIPPEVNSRPLQTAQALQQ